MTTGYVRHMDMTDQMSIIADHFRDIPLFSLVVIDIEQNLHSRAADLL